MKTKQDSHKQSNAQAASDQAKRPTPLTAEQLKQVSGGLPRSGWSVPSDAQTLLPRSGW